MSNKVKEGDVYKVVKIFDRTFELRYGYYNELDRNGKYNEPIPIYPDFSSTASIPPRATVRAAKS